MVRTYGLSDLAPAAAELEVPGEVRHAALSVLVPGLGQLAQDRPVTAAIQIATVASYLVTAHALGGARALWLALAWNVWSAVEAYWRAPRETS